MDVLAIHTPWNWFITEAKSNGDKIFEKNGATVIIEKLSYLFVIGSQVDYEQTLLASGFQLKNPT